MEQLNRLYKEVNKIPFAEKTGNTAFECLDS